MLKSPKISIIIPSYNKVKYIGKTLESIVVQKYPNLEVFIQDGGSTDGTLEIIKKYAKKFPKIFKYESKKDNGQLDAINRGLSKSSGEIISFINADDIYQKGVFSEIERLYRLNVDGLWFAGRGNVIDAKGMEIAKWATIYKNLLLLINLRFFLLCTNYLMQPSVFVTKSAWKQFGSFTGTRKFVMEYDLWLKISKIKMPIVTNKYLSSFRIEPSTISKKSTDILLKEDGKIIRRYTTNPFIFILHSFHNLVRLVVGKIV